MIKEGRTEAVIAEVIVRCFKLITCQTGEIYETYLYNCSCTEAKLKMMRLKQICFILPATLSRWPCGDFAWIRPPQLYSFTVAIVIATLCGLTFSHQLCCFPSHHYSFIPSLHSCSDPSFSCIHTTSAFQLGLCGYMKSFPFCYIFSFSTSFISTDGSVSYICSKMPLLFNAHISKKFPMTQRPSFGSQSPIWKKTRYLFLLIHVKLIG